MMFLRAPLGDFQFSGRGFVGLFHKGMQNDDFAIDHRAVENACNAFGCFQSQLKQSITHRSGVRHAEIRAINFHALSVSNDARNKTCRQSEDFGFELLL